MIQNQTIGMRFIHQQMNGKTDALNLLTIKIFVAVFFCFGRIGEIRLIITINT